MPKTLTETSLIRTFRALLNDEHGVSLDAYEHMGKVAEDCSNPEEKEALLNLLYRCDAVDDRYFLPCD